MKNSRMIAVGIVALISSIVYNVVAEEPAINPARITTPQIVVYGTSSDSTFAGGVTIAGTAGLGAVTASSVSSSGKVTSYARATATAPSTSGYMIEYGTTVSTNLVESATRLYTQAFTTAFSAAPVVIASYVTNASGLPFTGCVIQAVSPGTNFVISLAHTTVNWIAVGPKTN